MLRHETHRCSCSLLRPTLRMFRVCKNMETFSQRTGIMNSQRDSSCASNTSHNATQRHKIVSPTLSRTNLSLPLLSPPPPPPLLLTLLHSIESKKKEKTRSHHIRSVVLCIDVVLSFCLVKDFDEINEKPFVVFFSPRFYDRIRLVIVSESEREGEIKRSLDHLRDLLLKERDKRMIVSSVEPLT